MNTRKIYTSLLVITAVSMLVFLGLRVRTETAGKDNGMGDSGFKGCCSSKGSCNSIRQSQTKGD